MWYIVLTLVLTVSSWIGNPIESYEEEIAPKMINIFVIYTAISLRRSVFGFLLWLIYTLQFATSSRIKSRTVLVSILSVIDTSF